MMETAKSRRESVRRRMALKEIYQKCGLSQKTLRSLPTSRLIELVPAAEALVCEVCGPPVRVEELDRLLLDGHDVSGFVHRSNAERTRLMRDGMVALQNPSYARRSVRLLERRGVELARWLPTPSIARWSLPYWTIYSAPRVSVESALLTCYATACAWYLRFALDEAIACAAGEPLWRARGTAQYARDARYAQRHSRDARSTCVHASRAEARECDQRTIAGLNAQVEAQLPEMIARLRREDEAAEARLARSAMEAR